MPHLCTDWSKNPPERRTPWLVLARGDRRIYTPVPKDLETLEQVAKIEFGLGDVDVHFSSSCANLCDGLPARITPLAWEHVSPFIGCATVEVAAEEEEQPPRSHTAPKRRLSDDASPTTSSSDQHEVGDGPPRKQRRVASETAEPEGEPNVPITTPASPVASPVIKKEKISDARSQEPDEPDRVDDDAQRPIKQEKVRARTASHSEPPHTESQETRSQAPAESNEIHKVMIRVAHRPSNQESKFTTKNTTKVHKVLVGACKSFGLDPDRATMYLIVMIEDEEGQVENLFPCDRNDTIARAGAERDTESKFLLKIAGED